MQTKNPFLDDFARLMTNAAGAAQGVGEEVQALFRAQAERFVADMDLVRRDEFEAMKALAEAASARAEAAEEQLAALEARLAALEKSAGSGQLGDD
jgi:BMFP domain-containing protein YqiC